MPDAGAGCLPELFRKEPPPGALYYRAGRHGVAMLALRQRDLSEAQLKTILRYRLVHALMNGDVDPDAMTARGADHEWWFPGSPDDVHLVAATPDEGHILCYMALATLPGATPDMTLFTAPRPQFEVEDNFGPSVFHGIAAFRGVPLTAFLEGRRFFRAKTRPVAIELGTRSSVELGVAFYRTIVDGLTEVVGVVGDVEAAGAQANLGYFGLPHVRMQDARPVSATPYPGAVREVRAYPVALLTQEMRQAEPRVAAIEDALGHPGKDGLQRLFALFSGRRLSAGLTARLPVESVSSSG